MTPEEFEANMFIIGRASEADPEEAHGLADELMVKALNDLGFIKGTAIFKNMTKWYA